MGHWAEMGQKEILIFENVNVTFLEIQLLMEIEIL